MRKISRLLATVGGGALAMMSVPAFAQAAPSADDTAQDGQGSSGGLGDIIVTARRVAENLQDVPVAVTAFSGQDLQNQNVQSVQDLGRFTPGMQMRSGSSSSSAVTITVRGQVQTDILATLDPSVGTYVDGVYWARAYGLNGGLLDAQSVQVLKGPQGTLFGRNTTGGALILQSNDPNPSDFSGMASVSYGNLNELKLTGMLNVPIVTDRVALRLAGSRLTRDGYTHNAVTGSDLDERDRLNLRAKLLIEPTNNLSLLFSAEYFDMDESAFGKQLNLLTTPYTASNPTYSVGGTGALYAGLIACQSGLAPAGSNCTPAGWTQVGLGIGNATIGDLANNPNRVYAYYDPFVRARTYTYGFTGTLDSTIGEFKLIAGYRRVRSDAGIDLTSDGFPTHFTYGDQRLSQQSIEFQWTGTALNDALNFVIGAFTFHEQGYDSSITLTLPGLNTLTNHYYGYIDNDSNGIYAQATFKVTDALSFTGGLRYSVDDKGLTSRTNNYNQLTQQTICALVPGTYGFTTPSRTLPNGIALGVGEVVDPAECAITRRSSFAGVSYTIGAEYQVTPDVMVYLRHAKGFRAGGQNLRAPSAALFLPFRPEVAYNYEIGVKSEWFDRRVRLNIAAYQMDVTDIQRSTLVGVQVGAQTLTGTILGNAGKARFRGAEAELQIAVTPELRLSASGALVDPQYLRYADLSGDRSHDRFAGIAESQWAVAADYSRNFGDVGLNLHVDYSWTGKQANTEYNWAANPQNDAIIAATTTPATGLLGARIGLTFADGRYEIAAYGRNLTNNRNAAGGLAVLPLGYTGIVRQEPRTYGLTATARF